MSSVEFRSGSFFVWEDTVETEKSEKNLQHHEQSTPLSSGEMDPGLVLQDKQRQAEIEKNLPRDDFFKLMVNAKLHKKAVAQSERFLQNEENYTKYLLGVQFDLEQIETALQEHKPSIQCLSKLYRREALASDLHSFKNKETPQNLHQDYLGTLVDKPHLLLCHFSIHLLGFFLGGQIIKGKIQGTWSTNLYTFSDEPKILMDKFIQEMNAYLRELPYSEYLAYKNETQKAWELAIEL